MADLLFEIAVNDVQELFAGLDVGGRAGKMGPDMILQDLAQQAIDRAATAGNPLQYIGTANFCFQRALDAFDLPSNTTYPVQQLGFLSDGVGHERSVPEPRTQMI